ncbi:MAG: hypothetical protein J0I06_01470 [Planctomycetes bacterium]|nr:hypothetical protein [Planctomycetota bacterium]
MKPDDFGLLANGTSGCWSVDLDESPDGVEWSLQLDGPQVYLAFSLRALAVIRAAANYLRASRTEAGPLQLGSFASGGVSLHWDNECPDRCFLVVSGFEGSALRITLSTDDTRMLSEALEQVQVDLPNEPVG